MCERGRFKVAVVSPLPLTPCALHRCVPHWLPSSLRAGRETANSPCRISTLAAAVATHSPLPTSGAPPELQILLPVALALAVERVAVPILAIAVSANFRATMRGVQTLFSVLPCAFDALLVLVPGNTLKLLFQTIIEFTRLYVKRLRSHGDLCRSMLICATDNAQSKALQ